MPLHDQRIFQDVERNEWWTAQVLSASGFGWGSTPQATTTDGVVFSKVGEDEAQSRSIHTVSGDLTRATHASLVRLLRSAKPIEGHFSLHAANTPDPDRYGSDVVKDAEGLRWGFSRTQTLAADSSGSVSSRFAIDFWCQDDFGLRGLVGFEDEAVFREFVAKHGNSGLLALIEVVKQKYVEVPHAEP